MLPGPTLQCFLFQTLQVPVCSTHHSCRSSHQPAGVVYHYFQMSVGKIAPEIVAESSQPIGKTLRPVWGMMMDKCYPETTQDISPRPTGRQNDSAPKEETNTLPQEEGQEKQKVQQEVAEYPSGKTACSNLLQRGFCDSKEERLWGWAPQLLRKESSGRAGFLPLTLPRCRALNEKGSNKPWSSCLYWSSASFQGPHSCSNKPHLPASAHSRQLQGHCFLPRLVPLVDTLQVARVGPGNSLTQCQVPGHGLACCKLGSSLSQGHLLKWLWRP
ncbi:uncharacterized protein LOC110349357 isoform X3 [Heterocephalus glaber]|uniref:Uncharacterized protein LOC110349357 isoform X3 n=1 Tax=Heterocephalus glaber TaxID=10181 RepID=A0AAX6SYI5_HETGA|nr:uncharacterized protein LOC110349357 isoform X3 [Heterocephalus glaber]XP_021114529.1 uncharacterized protein LOC110349357 isoform X3 [Heterocephalus glaber]